jgi:pimeloyl-ACP methyl ester carboxylesterase
MTAVATHPSRSQQNIIRAPQREVEALLGGAVLNTVGRAAQNIAYNKSKLVAKEVYLPECNYTMYYHEREAVIDGRQKIVDQQNQPTILFFHGLSMRSEDLAGFIASLNIPPHIRILCPEQMGHGRDIDNRLRTDPDNYTMPTHQLMLDTTSEFLDVVKVGSNTNAFGISLGGAVCYYIHHHRPDIIKRGVLVSPAILCCVDKDLLFGVQDGSNNFCSAKSREDLKLMLRDLSTGRDDDTRKKRDPVPKFILESVYRQSKKKAPEGHFRELLLNLMSNAGLTQSTYATTFQHKNLIAKGSFTDDSSIDIDEIDTNPFTAVKDIDADANRLVIWPEKDRIINYEEGRRFFEVSMAISSDGELVSRNKNTEFETIRDCGHVFDANGRMIFDLIRPRVREYLLEFEGENESTTDSSTL